MGRVAIVTGTSRGLGFALAKKLEQEKLDSQHLLEKSLNYDVTNEFDVNVFVESVITKFNHIDLLINNAAYCNDIGDITTISIEEAIQVINTNLIAPYYIIHQLLPTMLKQNSGLIINISSEAAIKANSGIPMYAASKAGLETLSSSIQGDLNKKGSKVKCVYYRPPAMNTKMREDVVHDSAFHLDPSIVAEKIYESEIEVYFK